MRPKPPRRHLAMLESERHSPLRKCPSSLERRKRLSRGRSPCPARRENRAALAAALAAAAAVRSIAFARFASRFPEAHEVEAWGEPTFRVKNKIFAMYAAFRYAPRRGPARACGSSRRISSRTCSSTRMPIATSRRRTSGPRGGWASASIDRPTGRRWSELLRDAYLLTAPKRIAAQLDAR